jgi:hypothetical protein
LVTENGGQVRQFQHRGGAAKSENNISFFGANFNKKGVIQQD